MGQYAQTFADNDIDFEVLPHLGEQELEKLGVSLGHRIKLLRAIAALADLAPSVPAATTPDSAPRIEAERRQLTVMFCDLVGSTALAAQLDPEDTREVIRAYQNTVAGEIGRLEGHVAKFMGDGVLAYFGWPRAHEDEAERAVRAGLALTEAIGRLETPGGEALAARIGIATGLVVVGDLVGEGAAQEEAVVGETPNLAARLQALAQPGQIVIAEGTRRLLGDLFDLEDLGAQRLKGIAEPMAAFVVVGERPLQSRFEAHSGPALRPMVGRDQELALLLERWGQAKAGEGQGVLLVGEAGIGKSRIGRALLDALADEPHVPVCYQCSPYHTDSALWPVIQQLGHAAGLGPDEPVEDKLDKLEALLGRADGRDAAPLFADLLGIDGTARYGKLDLEPQVQRARTLEALVGQLLGLAARQPVLLVLEDAHWIDPTTLELIEQCLDRIAAARVLLLLTSRPDHQPELVAHPHVTRFTLNRLGSAGVEAIVARLGGDHLPAETVDAIIARTDGVPLFVEELTKAILETGEVTIPASLYDSLMARLDRIPEVKEVAQIAACIGREFHYALLAAVMARDEADLSAALDKLAAAELIFRHGRPPAATYTFKHALVQDAAYQSLLKSKRKKLHGRVAHVLETQFPETVASEPELLARHCAEAGAIEQAAIHWRHAGLRASERFAYVEAIHDFTTALRLLGRLPHSVTRDRQELALWLALGPALMSKGSWSAPEVGEAYQRAHELGRRVGSPKELFAATWGLWSHNSQCAHHETARHLTDELVALAEKEGGSEMPLQAHHAAWTTYEHLGDAVSSRQHALQGIGLYRADAHHAHVLAYGGHDPGVCARFHNAGALWQLGYPDQALDSAHDAVELARQVAHPSSLVPAMHYLATMCWWRREAEPARRHAEEVIALCAQHDIPRSLGPSRAIRGWAMTVIEGGGAGLADIEQGLADLDVGGPELRRVDCLIILCEARRSLFDLALALDALKQAQVFLHRSGLRRLAPEVVRLEGELLLCGGSEPRTAAALFQEALASARDQQAKILELRAAASLARLWAEHGERRQKAHDLLAPVYDWFTEGFDTPDLIEAKALLDALQ